MGCIINNFSFVIVMSKNSKKKEEISVQPKDVYATLVHFLHTSKFRKSLKHFRKESQVNNTSTTLNKEVPDLLSVFRVYEQHRDSSMPSIFPVGTKEEEKQK